MRRREVIAVLGAAAWSGAIWAQPAERVHRLGALLPAAQVALLQGGNCSGACEARLR